MAEDSSYLDDDALQRADFDEENSNLSQFEATLSCKIDSARSQRDTAFAKANEIRGYAVDADDFANFKSEQTIAQHAAKEVERLELRAGNPYFGHVDLRNSKGDVATYYVGDYDIILDGLPKVVSWKADMANVFYQKQYRDFTVSGKQYSLLLRREVSIQDAILKSVHTEYDAARKDLPGEVVDPFLIQVLLDRRRAYKLSDIIVTIQENQNEIMRQPIDESFIVQGCAGSGKTMILLHRLSYLIYNHPEIKLNSYVVITPSDFFDKNIAGLSARLQVDDIKRYTLADFYIWLIRELSRPDKYVEENKGRKISKVKLSIPQSVNPSESSLSAELLSSFYSETFLNELRVAVTSKKESVIRQLEEEGLLTLFQSRGLDVPSSKDSPFEIYLALNKNLRALNGLASGAAERVREAEAELQSSKTKIDAVQARADEVAKRREAIYKVLIDALEEASDTQQHQLDEIESHLDVLKARRQEMSKKLEDAQTEIVKIEDEALAVAHELAGCKRPSEILGATSEAAEAYREVCEQKQFQLEREEIALRKTVEADANALHNAQRAMLDAEEELRKERDALAGTILQDLNQEQACLQAESNLLKERLSTAQTSEGTLADRKAGLEEQVRQLDGRIARVTEAKRSLTGAPLTLSDLRELGSECAEACSDLARQVESMSARRAVLGFLAFREKRYLDTQIASLQLKIQEAARQTLDKQTAELRAKRESACEELAILEENLEVARTDILEVRMRLADVEEELTECGDAISSWDRESPCLTPYANNLLNVRPEIRSARERAEGRIKDVSRLEISVQELRTALAKKEEALQDLKWLRW